MRKLPICLLFMLCGCVTVKPVALPNGESGYAIDCSGAEKNMSDCMNKAAEICGGRYEIVNQDGSSGGAVAVPVGQNSFFVPVQRRILMVNCPK